MLAALLALALSAQSQDALGAAGPERGGEGAPCVARDARGRAFAVCFDPGNRLELSAAGARGRDERSPSRGSALELAAALRWRRDLRAPAGTLEWTLDQTFVDGRARFAAGASAPRSAEGFLWRGTFLRHRQEPFVFVPGPRPRRLPFPFDVGLLVEAGGAAWDAERPRDVRLLPLRSALLLDVARHRVFRRLAFGPEVAWGVDVAAHAAAIHELVPFTGGVVDARAESASGLSALSLTVHGGSLVAVPGGAKGYVEARLDLERTVAAVNDRPLALFVAATGRGGPRGRAAEVSAGVRLALPR